MTDTVAVETWRILAGMGACAVVGLGVGWYLALTTKSGRATYRQLRRAIRAEQAEDR